ncbi:MAG: radical SAM protein [Myxococcaceae bacterium]
MDHLGAIFRPPSEADSLLLQVTLGCSHNRCSFCAMYRQKEFAAKPWEVVERDLRQAARFGPEGPRRVFLCDGEALILSQRHLVRILEGVRSHLPWVTRVSTYGDCRSILRKSVLELRELGELGLRLVYQGLESGDDLVLSRIDKGSTREEAITAAARLREAGLAHSVIVLLGLGGTGRSREHALATASMLTEIDPRFASALTLTVVPGTRLHEEQQRGEFSLPGKLALLEELHTVIEQARFTRCRFSANHASNYLPLTAELPRRREELLRLLREVIDRGDESVLKPEWMRGL